MLAQTRIFNEIFELVKNQSSTSGVETGLDISALFNECRLQLETDSEMMLASLFLNALNKRYFSQELDTNLYEKQYEVSQIQLFDILIHKFPFVRISQQMINKAILQKMAGHEEVTLIDIGIGLGTQMLHVLEGAKSLQGLKKINLIGLEPFEDALMAATGKMHEIKSSLPFELQFIPVKAFAEKIDFKQIAGINGPVIVNASLALHHIQSQGQRLSTLAAIATLNPIAFFITEPNVNHFEQDLYLRMQNSYKHFSALFAVIDQLSITSSEKNALKLFFGREIEDILGKREADRFEKHELAEGWLSKLSRIGLKPDLSILQVPFYTETFVQIKAMPEGFIGFTYANETVLSVMNVMPS